MGVSFTHWPLGNLDAIEKCYFPFCLSIGILRSSYENALWWTPQELTDDKSTLIKVIAWWRQATSHYLSQCWPRSKSPYGITWAQWVNLLALGDWPLGDYELQAYGTYKDYQLRLSLYVCSQINDTEPHVMAWCTPASVDLDLYRHMASLGHNDSTYVCHRFTDVFIFFSIYKRWSYLDLNVIDIYSRVCSWQ